MSASTSSPGRRHSATNGSHSSKSPVGRPLARIFLRTAGLSSLIAWAVLLVWASFGTGASTGSSGVYMIIGTVVSVLLVAVVVTTAATHSGIRIIIAGLFAAIFAAAAGWAVYSAMPEAGPYEFITHRAGVAAMSYGFGVFGGGLLALSEFVVEGYSGGRVNVTKRMRRKIGVLAAAIVIMAAAALAPAMQRWAELANQDVRVGDATGVGSEASFDEMTSLAGVQRFAETPYGLLRVDHPTNPTPQAVTLLDPVSGAALWYHRRWNWHSAQPPVLSHAQDLVALSGPRADNADDYQTRVLRARTGEEVATVEFEGTPGLLTAMSDDRLVYGAERGRDFAAYDFAGRRLWDSTIAVGCESVAAEITSEQLIMLADCVPAPDRAVARDYLIAFDLDDGSKTWEREIDRNADVPTGSFLVTEDKVVIDSRIERRVTDGPFSARKFEHKLLAYDIASGEQVWRNRNQVFGSTHSSACGGTLHLSQPVVGVDDSGAAAGGDGRAKASAATGQRTVQLVECYTAQHREGSWLGVMSFDLDSGDRLYRKSVKLGFTPLDPEVARGWATVLPDNRALVATDLSLDPNSPDCRLYEVKNAEAARVDIEDEALPKGWCHDAQLTTVASAAAVSYVNEDGKRSILLVS